MSGQYRTIIYRSFFLKRSQCSESLFSSGYFLISRESKIRILRIITTGELFTLYPPDGSRLPPTDPDGPLWPPTASQRPSPAPNGPWWPSMAPDGPNGFYSFYIKKYIYQLFFLFLWLKKLPYRKKHIPSKIKQFAGRYCMQRTYYRFS